MIQIFYGMGKGKTSAINGQAVRAHGADLKVGIFRFLKGMESSENETLKSIGITVMNFHSSEKFVIQMNEIEKNSAKEVMQKGLNQIIEIKDKFDIIMLDEILDLTCDNVNLLTEKQLFEFINSISVGKEIFLSGHTVVKSVFEIADLITHFEKEKHYFDKGVKARKGIEY